MKIEFLSFSLEAYLCDKEENITKTIELLSYIFAIYGKYIHGYTWMAKKWLYMNGKWANFAYLAVYPVLCFFGKTLSANE